MAFVPSTVVRLLNVPFERDYKNVLYYSNKDAQTETLMGMTVKTFTDFTYQRKDNVIKVPAHIDSLWNCNYVMYQNSNYTNKWFYAFIINMEYVNNGLTKLYIETDVYNTWCFDINIKPSFIEREHSKDDIIGENTIDENLELGEFVVNDTVVDDHMTSNTDDFYVIVGVTKTKDGDRVMGNVYGGLYSGVGYYAFPANKSDEITDFLSGYDVDGIGESVQCMFIMPKVFVENYVNKEGGITDITTETKYDINLAFPYTLDTHIPRNNKLLTFPYQALNVSNAQGGSATFKMERFSNFSSGFRFRVKGTVTPGGSIKCLPVGYNINRSIDIVDDDKLHYRNEDYGLPLGKFPICNWNSDVYTNWLTQNSINMAVENFDAAMSVFGGAIAGGVAGFALGGPVGAVAGIGLGAVGGASVADNAAGVATGTNLGSNITQIAGIIGRRHAMSFTPPQLKGNLNCGDIMYASKRNTFYFHYMSVRKEYAEIIDSYFDMFGYAVNQVKTPEKAHRGRYWFTKTAGLNCDGAVPQEDMAVFKQIYDNGVTFWRNPAEIEDYSLENSALGKYVY